MEEYRIILKNEKISRYNTIARVFIFFNIAAAIFVAVNKNDTGVAVLLTIAVSLLLIILLQFFRRAKDKKRLPNHVEWSLGLMIIPWLVLQLYWIAIAVSLFSLLYVLAIRILSVHISTDKIIYPSFPKQSFYWQDLRNLILKDGLLTIDLKNNKLIQQFVSEEFSSIDEKEFNEFCRRQLQTASVI